MPWGVGCGGLRYSHIRILLLLLLFFCKGFFPLWLRRFVGRHLVFGIPVALCLEGEEGLFSF